MLIKITGITINMDYNNEEFYYNQRELKSINNKTIYLQFKGEKEEPNSRELEERFKDEYPEIIEELEDELKNIYNIEDDYGYSITDIEYEIIEE